MPLRPARTFFEFFSAVHSKGNQIGAGVLFADCLSAFRRALAKTDIELPAGQATHVLRHTFASHYMMNGGDLLKLQKLLGHSTVVMTMRYAHLAPNALEDVLDKHALHACSSKVAQIEE